MQGWCVNTVSSAAVPDSCGRLEVYALRPAPIQVNAIGYPGTMGAPYISHLLTDRVRPAPTPTRDVVS